MFTFEKLEKLMQIPKLISVLAISLIACSGNSQDKAQTQEKPMADANKVVKSEEEWKKVLTPEQYHILREKGTDYPGTGKFYLHKEKGMYVCAGCGNELFTSDMKFDSHCGWPSFDREIEGGKIKQIVDKSLGMVRIEIVCAKCDGHLGHIFDDGPTATGQRYCVNSTSIDFKKDENVPIIKAGKKSN